MRHKCNFWFRTRTPWFKLPWWALDSASSLVSVSSDSFSSSCLCSSPTISAACAPSIAGYCWYATLPDAAEEDLTGGSGGCCCLGIWLLLLCGLLFVVVGYCAS